MEEKTVKIPAIITVGELANSLGVPVSNVIAELMKNGVMATINENIDFETAEIIAEFLGLKVEPEVAQESKKKKKTVSDEKNYVPRPPVVAVLGHVDHGKTSLLDKIRETNVVARESGGITQHIGAYQAEIKGKKITFLDTPGHEAFEKMRAHGAKITDIAIIIVGADDGIKPQTTEAIRHVKEASTPMLVVINKIDKPDADVMRVKTQFSEIGIPPQEWGGTTEFVEVSAKTGAGIEELLDIILVTSELLDIKADPSQKAQGVVIESRLEVGKGPVASILIQNGTLKIGDFFQVGETFGKVKAMEDENGNRIKEATPSRPVKISGLRAVPQVAELMAVFDTEQEARAEASKTQKYSGVKRVTSLKKVGLEEISARVLAANKKELNIVVKADVKGSLEAVKESLVKLNNNDVGVKFVGEGVGDVSESDVSMAEISDKVVVCFKVGFGTGVEQLAKKSKVKVLRYDVIYELIDDIRKILAEMMPIERTEIPVGILKVLGVFKASPQKTVVGGKVEDGRAEKDVQVRVKRGGEVIGNYSVASVQREKEEVSSVPAGSQCGVSINSKADIKVDDVLEFYRVEENKKAF
jgi:translation initiation factor IF-2